jgi:hypothetical protein
MKQITRQFRQLAEPVARGEKIAAIISRAGRVVGMGYSRAFETWYDRSKLSDEEDQRIQTALETKSKQDDRNELRQLRLRLEILESRLLSKDADFHREDVAGLRASMCGRG